MSANEHFSSPGRAPDDQGSPQPALASDFQSLLDRVAEHIGEAEQTLPEPNSDRSTGFPSASDEAARAIRSVRLIAGVVPASSVGFAGDGCDRAGDRQADQTPATEIPIVSRSPSQDGGSKSFNPADAIEAWIAQAAPRHPSGGSRVASDTGCDSARITLMEERLAQIAHLMGEIAGIVAKRSREDGLSSVEAQIRDIGSRLDAMPAGSGTGFDLEQRFSDLTDRISRRHVAALTAQSEAIGREISSVAGAVAEHISAKLVLASDRIAAQERRLEDVHACIEKFVGEQQQIAVRTHTLLDATQQIAMGLLERMDGLERDDTKTERRNASTGRHTVLSPIASYLEPDFTTPADGSSASAACLALRSTHLKRH